MLHRRFHLTIKLDLLFYNPSDVTKMIDDISIIAVDVDGEYLGTIYQKDRLLHNSHQAHIPYPGYPGFKGYCGYISGVEDVDKSRLKPKK